MAVSLSFVKVYISQKLAEDNATRRQALTEMHTLGPKPISLVREKLVRSYLIFNICIFIVFLFVFVAASF